MVFINQVIKLNAIATEKVNLERSTFIIIKKGSRRGASMRKNVLEIVTLEEIYYFVWFHDQTFFLQVKEFFIVRTYEYCVWFGVHKLHN